MDTRTPIEEHEAERMIDARVQRATQRDRRYLNAENAEQQSQAELVIELEATVAVLEKYDVDGWSLEGAREQLEAEYAA